MWARGRDWRQSGDTSFFPPSVLYPFPLGFSPTGRPAPVFYCLPLSRVFCFEAYIYLLHRPCWLGTPWMVGLCSHLGPTESQYTSIINPLCATKVPNQNLRRDSHRWQANIVLRRPLFTAEESLGPKAHLFSFAQGPS